MPYDVTNITIRPAGKEQLSTVADLAGRIWPDAYRTILSGEQIRYMLKMMYDLPVLEKEYAEGIWFDLIYDGDEPIGFASCGPCPEHPHSGAKLHKLYLDKAYHGRGIGTLALRHVIEEVRSRKYHVLYLNVNRHNATALRAYERNGFVKKRESVADIGGGFVMDDYVMAITL